ncbi:MAG: hypothetical protein KDA28_08095, partial [Phycisphaerales bacterium]|nr:hypothetical protein [Phycisphaerales bacterium]
PSRDDTVNTAKSGGAAQADDAVEPGQAADGVDDEGFADNAFPPTLSDTSWHARAWQRNDCLRCHETGVGEAPPVQHASMPQILLTAKCRTCHVFIPGSKPRDVQRPDPSVRQGFAANAFPPMIPASESHPNTWTVDNCLMCHESGVRDAPVVQHRGMPPVLLKSKCRTCHVQVRSFDPVPLDGK